MTRPFPLLAVLLVTLSGVGTAGAQSSAPTAKQIELNNLGLDAQDAGNHTLAAPHGILVARANTSHLLWHETRIAPGDGHG